MKVETAQVGKCNIRVWRGGKGAPLLYFHDFEQHPGAAPFLEDLAQTFEVCAPERPGYGQSTGVETIQDMLDLVLHLRSVAEYCGRGPVHLVGHGLGGMLAAELAVIAPNFVRRLVLVNSYGLWIDDQPLPDPFVLMPDALATAKWSDTANASGETSAFDPTVDGSEQAFRTQNLSAATKFMWPIPDRGLARRIGYIRAPTLILHGEDDGLVPLAYAQALTSQIAGSQLQPISHAGHLPMVEHKDAFVTALREFLL